MPVTPVMVISGRKTTIGVRVEPISGTRISRSALRMASPRLCAGVAVQDDVLDDDDRVVDHQSDGGGQAAERHQVEALAEERMRDERDGHGGGNDQAGNQRSAPVAQEQTRMIAARTRPMRMASRTLRDGIADELD